MEWLDEELEGDPAFQKRVDAALNEMRIEQDLISLRKERRISQSELAKRIGVSQPMIARLEAGRVRNLTLRTIARYAAALGGQVRIEIAKPQKRQRVTPLLTVREKAATYRDGRRRYSAAKGRSAAKPR